MLRMRRWWWCWSSPQRNARMRSITGDLRWAPPPARRKGGAVRTCGKSLLHGRFKEPRRRSWSSREEAASSPSKVRSEGPADPDPVMRRRTRHEKAATTTKRERARERVTWEDATLPVSARSEPGTRFQPYRYCACANLCDFTTWFQFLFISREDENIAYWNQSKMRSKRQTKRMHVNS